MKKSLLRGRVERSSFICYINHNVLIYSSSAKKKKTIPPSKDKSGDSANHNNQMPRTLSLEEAQSVSSSLSAVTALQSNPGLKTTQHTQNNTFKVRNDMSYMYTGSTASTTDIPIFREEFLEHNKVTCRCIVVPHDSSTPKLLKYWRR